MYRRDGSEIGQGTDESVRRWSIRILITSVKARRRDAAPELPLCNAERNVGFRGSGHLMNEQMTRSRFRSRFRRK